MIYNLMAKFDDRKDFYGKARVEDNESNKKLYSYNTLVAEIDGDMFIIYNVDNVFSSTTLRHIKDFYRQFFNNIPVTIDDLRKFLK